MWIHTHTPNPIQVHQYNPSHAQESFGVFIAPDRTKTQQVQHMRQQANTWADHIRTGRLRQHEVSIALQTTILKQLEYPLATLDLTYQECEYIQRPVFQAALPNMRICRTFPLALRFAPLEYGGLGLPHL